MNESRSVTVLGIHRSSLEPALGLCLELAKGSTACIAVVLTSVSKLKGIWSIEGIFLQPLNS